MGATSYNARSIALEWNNVSVNRINYDDDYGARMLMAVSYYYSYAKEELSSAKKLEIPKSYFFIHTIIFCSIMLILFSSTRSLFSPTMSYLIGGLILGSSNIGLISHVGDIYMFPFYAGVLALGIADEVLRGKKINSFKVAIFTLGIIVFNLFRSSSIYSFFIVLVTLFFSSKLVPAERLGRVRRILTYSFFGAILCQLLISSFAGKRSHSVWHPLHAGLYEWGGHLDREGNTYPYFVDENEIPNNSEYLSRWHDKTQFKIVNIKNPSVSTYGVRHEEILREDFLKIVKKYPLGILQLVFRRISRFLNLNPWLDLRSDSYIVDSFWNDLFKWASMIIIFVGVTQGLSLKVYIVVVGLLPLAAPPILVHSGYFMYNAPGHLPLYVLFAASLIGLCKRVAPRVFR